MRSHPRPRFFPVVALAALACLPAPRAAAAAPPAQPAAPLPQQLDAAFARDVQPILKQYCYTCHSAAKKKGDVALDSFTSLKSVQANRKLWRTVADQIAQQAMPPDSKPQPTPAQSQALLLWIEQAVNQYDCTGPRDPGRVTLRRLNRTEYNNTIRDLLGVDYQPAADFPADDTGYGFDNIADVLTMSPVLAERYLAAAETVLDKALTPYVAPKPSVVKYAGADFKPEVGTPQGGGAWNLETNGQITRRHSVDVDGEYELRVRAFQEAFGPDPARMAVRLDGKDLQTFDVTPLQDKPGTYTLRVPLTAGNHRFALAYLNNLVDRNNPDPKKRGDRNLIVDRMEIEGPFNPKAPPESPALKRVFFVKGGSIVSGKKLTDADAARQILYRFGTRAFRRPLAADEWDRLAKLYQSARDGGEPFEAALRVALSGILSSPHFLFRIEPDPAGPPGTVRNLTDYELATRLSYFLWSTTPDDELLDLAAKSRLRDPATLDAQVTRLLKDPRSAEFVKNFVGQWLELRNLETHAVDARTFPKFDARLRAAMKRETELFFEHLIAEDRSLLDLLTADYTYVNARLAEHYGLKAPPEAKGERDFVKVSLAGTHRSGVLTHGSILTMTAMPARTSPVKRGVFVLEQILGTPPPPPPPDVPPLADKPADNAAAPLRERLAAHRANPTCASCHMRMDGIGFALENFDPVGNWRDKEGRFPIDSTGELAGGRKINGADGLRDLLVSRKADVLRCLTEKLLTYALGRGLEDYDRCTVRDIVTQLEQHEYRFSALISAVVKSDPFQKRRSKRPDGT